MAVRRLSQSFLSTRGRGKQSSLIAGYGFGVDEMDRLAVTSAPAGGVGTLTISGIPSTYQHLQLRIIGKSSSTSSANHVLQLRFNNDAGSNYSWHRLEGSGASASSSGLASTTVIELGSLASSETGKASMFGAIVADILDYSNTSKFKTVRSIGGSDLNGSGYVAMSSGLWISTAAISSIVIYVNTGNYAESSRFALYGVVG